MHTLLKVTMTDLAAANATVSDGRLQKIVQQVSTLISPEASFFYSEYGYRAALFVFNLEDSSQIPQIAEPFFTELNAKVEFFPAMNVNELNIGLESWKKQEGSYHALS